MRKALTAIASAGMATAFLFSCGAPHSGSETYMGEFVIDVPGNYTLEQVVNKLEEALSRRATDIHKMVGFMPEELPQKPGHPIVKMKEFSLGIAGFTLPQVYCGDKAVATISATEPELSNAYGSANYGGYKVCVYPYKGGYRIYTIATYMYTSSNAIGNMLTKAIENTVVPAICKGLSKFDCWFKQIIEAEKAQFPNAKVIKVKAPEGEKLD